MNRRGAGVLGGRRRAGVLLHTTSLLSGNGDGLLGSARRFIDFLSACGMSVWQMLPIGPSHSGSPYDLASAHAGNPSYISATPLPGDFSRATAEDASASKYLKEAFAACERQDPPAEFEIFRVEQAYWLDDYALYQTLKEGQGGKPWWEWPQPLRDRKEDALAPVRDGKSFRWHRFLQWVFFHQWTELKHYAHDRGVLLFGDMPFFVAYDSAEVWAHRGLFHLDSEGRAEIVSGVPPDYFSAQGQRWGNPMFRWDAMEGDGFVWWRERLRTQLALFDLLRIDHFRGLEACWEIPGDAPTAASGHWAKAPGGLLLGELEKLWGHLPLVAEDLGVITDAVTELRDRHGLAGMKVLQFAFGDDSRNPYLPHNHVNNCVVYTGTHDNDTTAGWFTSLSAAQRERVYEYLGSRDSMPWALVRAAMASVADLAVVPMQDFLELDSSYRMNTPGSSNGNWTYRLSWDQITDDLVARMRTLTRLYQRD